MDRIMHLISKFSFLILSFIILSTLTGCNDDDDHGGGEEIVTVGYLWISSTDVGADIGASGADRECQSDSSSQSFVTSVNNHRAIIAYPSAVPADLSVNDPPMKRPDGTDIVPRFGDFFVPGFTASASVDGSSSTYWIGLDSTGNLSTSAHCSSWTSTSSSANGSVGRGNQTNAGRFYVQDDGCDNSHRILCISW